MTIAALLLAVSIPLSYSYPPGSVRNFDVSVHFEGYVPIMNGQPDADVEVKLSVAATGKEPDSDGNLQVTNEIKTSELLVNGTVIPFDIPNITRFFPKSTVSMTPFGKVLKTDAPDVELPVKLPGLHVKRFPEITYIPLELPEEGVEEGKEFTFVRMFGDSEMKYTVAPVKITDAEVSFGIKIIQSFTTLEDEFGNPVKSDGKVKVDTKVDGGGTAIFDRKAGIVKELKVIADATSEATDLQSQKKSQRKLKTTLTIKAAKP